MPRSIGFMTELGRPTPGLKGKGSAWVGWLCVCLINIEHLVGVVCSSSRSSYLPDDRSIALRGFFGDLM